MNVRCCFGKKLSKRGGVEGVLVRVIGEDKVHVRGERNMKESL